MNLRISAKLRTACSVAFLLLASCVLFDTAAAETVSGVFTYTDGDNVATPIRRATVEIYRRRARDLGIWGWGHDMTASTDDQGRLSVQMPFVQQGADYSLRVYAQNPAVQVTQKDIYFQNFYAKPGHPGEIIRTATNDPNRTHDFTFNFTDQPSRDHFNAADAALRGFDYAEARRDPSQTSETIARVTVHMTSAATYYDPTVHAVRLNSVYAMDDFSVLHEYAHYLQERISSFKGIPSSHNGCDALIGAVHVEEPGHAWMEGFATYFAAVVGLTYGADVDGPSSGTIPASSLESRGCTDRPGNHIAFEWPVAAALFDLVDTNNEQFENSCRVGTDIDRVIFQIFDKEMDIGWTNPTLQNFADAWAARALDYPRLNRIATANGITFNARTQTVYFDRAPAANLAVWRPANGVGVWHVSGGQSGNPTWGEPGDVPVPADYDGDGLTDMAIWRPRDGNWWVVLSATGVNQITQWGTAGDIPLPADYDGDKEADFAVFRPSDGTFYFFSDNCQANRAIKLSVTTGTPISGDFDKDGRADFGLYNPQSGFVVRYATGFGTSFAIAAAAEPPPTFTPASGGGRREIGGFRPPVLIPILPLQPVIGDYDGDRKSDWAVWSPSSGMWTVHASTRGRIERQWGQVGDIPVPVDFNGDGASDFAVWRPSTGEWFSYPLNGQGTMVGRWGQNGDMPIPAP